MQTSHTSSFLQQNKILNPTAYIALKTVKNPKILFIYYCGSKKPNSQQKNYFLLYLGNNCIAMIFRIEEIAVA